MIDLHALFPAASTHQGFQGTLLKHFAMKYIDRITISLGFALTSHLSHLFSAKIFYRLRNEGAQLKKLMSETNL